MQGGLQAYKKPVTYPITLHTQWHPSAPRKMMMDLQQLVEFYQHFQPGEWTHSIRGIERQAMGHGYPICLQL